MKQLKWISPLKKHKLSKLHKNTENLDNSTSIKEIKFII